MGETVVHKDAAREWEYLSFILESAERGREDKTVEITLEVAPRPSFWIVVVFKPEALVVNKPVP